MRLDPASIKSVEERVITLAAAIEAGTGLILTLQPSALVWLLLGAELSQAGDALGRIAGFALLALAWACWPRREGAGRRTAAPLALLIYNLLTTIYLAYLGIGKELVGMLLWPAVGIHAVLLIILVSTWFFRPTS
jgi:hypothetical protein